MISTPPVANAGEFSGFGSLIDIDRIAIRALAQMARESAVTPVPADSGIGDAATAFEQSLSRAIQLSGADPSATHKALRVFFWIGVALRSDAKSFKDVADFLKDRRKQKRCPVDIPLYPSAYSDYADKVRNFFGFEHFRLGEPADLFDSSGERSRVRDLTPLGRIAWYLTRDYVGPGGDRE